MSCFVATARHVREGYDVTLDDAEFTLRLVATVITYLGARAPK